MLQEYTGQNTIPIVLTINGETVAETRELHKNAAVSLKKRTKLLPKILFLFLFFYFSLGQEGPGNFFSYMYIP